MRPVVTAESLDKMAANKITWAKWCMFLIHLLIAMEGFS
jgi:hypothetical protein